MFCVLGFKLKNHIFYDRISVFINKTPKIYRERNHFDFLTIGSINHDQIMANPDSKDD